MRHFVFLVLVAALLFGPEHSQGPKIANAQEHAADSRTQTEQNKSFWQRTTDDPVALYTLVLSVFTGLLVVVTGGLIWIGWRQVRLTKDIAERQARDTEIIQRAYISAEPGGLTPHRDRGDRVHGSVIFRNVGHLPARNVRWYGTCGSWPETDGKTFPTEEPTDGKIVLPPGAASTQRVTTVFTNKLQNSLFVWGIITYEDGFGNQRFTRFCHAYGTKLIIGKLDATIPAEKAELHEYGNDAD